MKKNVTIGFVLGLVIAGFTILPVNVIAEDLLVHAEYPKYEVVVGRDVTFRWSLVKDRQVMGP